MVVATALHTQPLIPAGNQHLNLVNIALLATMTDTL